MTNDGPVTALVKIDGQPVHLASLPEAVDRMTARLSGGRGFTLFTFNLDHVVKRRNSPDFRAAYERATYVTADGAPIVWLARRFGVRLDRTTGADLVAPLCAAAAAKHFRVALFGSNRDSLENAARVLRRSHPGLDICFMEAPEAGFDPFSQAAREAGERIARSGARICLVALGAPKQELFCDRMAGLYSHIGYLGIGAALDFLSGQQHRAPRLLQHSGLEWAWRLATNPRRLAGRYALCAAAFFDMAFVAPLQRRMKLRSVTRA